MRSAGSIAGDGSKAPWGFELHSGSQCIADRQADQGSSSASFHEFLSHLTRFSHRISKPGRTSASRFATIQALTSFTVSSRNDLRHAPQTVKKFGPRLHMPVGRSALKFRQDGCGFSSQFQQDPGEVRRHADFIAAHGMRLSSMPSQA